MEQKASVLIYILRHDIRLSDNPVFHAAHLNFLKNEAYQKSLRNADEHHREDSLVSEDVNPPFFTHLLPVYIFPANQIEVSGFIPDLRTDSPYPEARSYVAGLWRTGPHRARFMAEGIWDLKERLEGLQCGSGLQIRVGEIGEVVRHMVQWFEDEKGAGRNIIEVAGIWMTAEEGTEEKKVENEVKHLAEDVGVDFKLWEDEKYYVDDRDLPYQNIADVPNVYTTYRKLLEPLRSRPRRTIPAPERLPPLPGTIPPQKHPFQIPTTLNDLVDALLRPLNMDPAFGLSFPPKMPSGTVSAHPFRGGESSAQDRLSHLILSGAMSSYKNTRNGMLGLDFSTKLSAFLAQGHITARQIHWAMVDFEEGQGPGKGVKGYGKGENDGTAAVRFELLWRDYMRLCAKKFGARMYILEGIQEPPRHSRVNGSVGVLVEDERRPPRKRWKQLDKSAGLGDTPGKTQEIFERFRSGRTGIGLIDASNRELFLTGYTSNRARQNVASFLCHHSHLGIDWRIGAEWYEFLLTDYDMASNYGNWQYVAGVGNDPRQGRVFNPVKQALDYDPQGEYIKAWVPEMRGVRLKKSVEGNDKDMDQQRLMGLYQAWRLEEHEKSSLGLKGVEWVERPLVKIQFSVGRNRGHNARGRCRGWRGKGRGKDIECRGAK